MCGHNLPQLDNHLPHDLESFHDLVWCWNMFQEHRGGRWKALEGSCPPEHQGSSDWREEPICLLSSSSLSQKTYTSKGNSRLISWWITFFECRKSSPLRTCFVTQIISNSLIGPQLSSFSRTDPPSPASIKRCTVSPQSTAPYNSAMFSCRKQAWISTSDGLNWSTGI